LDNSFSREGSQGPFAREPGVIKGSYNPPW